MTLVLVIRFMRIFTGVPWTRGVKRHSSYGNFQPFWRQHLGDVVTHRQLSLSAQVTAACRSGYYRLRSVRGTSDLSPMICDVYWTLRSWVRSVLGSTFLGSEVSGKLYTAAPAARQIQVI